MNSGYFLDFGLFSSCSKSFASVLESVGEHSDFLDKCCPRCDLSSVLYPHRWHMYFTISIVMFNGILTLYDLAHLSITSFVFNNIGFHYHSMVRTFWPKNNMVLYVMYESKTLTLSRSLKHILLLEFQDTFPPLF